MEAESRLLAREAASYSRWQVKRIKLALWQYHRDRRRIEGKEFTWRDVREDIRRVTGVELGKSVAVGGESLRKFATTSSLFTDIETVASFLMNPEIYALGEKELKESGFRITAPGHLTDFFASDCDEQTSISLQVLAGKYQAVFTDEGDWIVSTLRFELSEAEDFLYVEEAQSVYESESSAVAAADEKLEGARESSIEPLSVLRHEGFAVTTPEDRLMIFMKRLNKGTNHCYYALQDIGVYQQDVTRPLWLQHQQFGYLPPIDGDPSESGRVSEPRFDADSIGSWHQLIARDMRMFRRLHVE